MSEIERRASMGLRTFLSTKTGEMVITDRRVREPRAELRVPLDCLFEPVERCPNALIVPGQAVRQSTQVEVVGRKVGCRPLGRALDFRCLNRRFDDTRDTRCNVVLQVEYRF